MSAISRRYALAAIGGSIVALAAVAVLPATLEPVVAAPLPVARVLVENSAANLVSVFLVLDGRLAVYVNTRLTDERAAVAWAEHRAATGEILGVWWGDQAA